MSNWLERYERAGWFGRVGLVSTGAVRVAAKLIDKGLDRAATVTVEAKQAFDRELDPNMTTAQILDESNEPYDEPT